MQTTYSGSCHCGTVGFEVDIDLAQPAYRCNYGVNIGCIEGVSEEDPSRLVITYIDGMNDRWQDAPRFFAHL